MAIYVYGIMRARDAGCAVAAADSPPPLEAIEHEGVSALVSPTPGDELRLRRDTILAHSDVLQSAFEHGPVLPFRFGTAVADADAVVAELRAAGVPRLASRLEALDGQAEMQIKAIYAEEPLLRSILAQDSRLAGLVRRIQALPPAATHFERIRIGEAIAAAVQARSATDAETLMKALGPLSQSHAVSPPNHERSVLKAAFLVGRADLDSFDRAVESLSRQHSPRIDFTLIGPLPPYSFGDHDFEAEEVKRAWA